MVKKEDEAWGNRKVCIEKGSFTVEISAVMGIVVFVVFATLYLCFYVHNRAWLTSAAYEAALTGSMEAIKDDGKVYEVAVMRGQELGNVGFFGAENLSMQVNTGKTVSVVYDLDTIVSFGGLQWHLRAEGISKVIEPVQRIRKIKAAAETIKSITGE